MTALEQHEARAISIPWSEATQKEWRNTPWGEWSEVRQRKRRFGKSHEGGQRYADRIINFQNRYDYNGVWAPTDLKAFDVIRCDLPTDYMEDGNAELWPRNCLVLGMHLDRDTFELESIALLKFAHEKGGTGYNPDYELYLDRLDPEIRTKIPLGHSEILRTGKLEIVPVSDLNFGFYIDRVCRMHPSLADSVEDALSRGFEHRRQYGSKTRLRHTQDQVFVPSLDPEDWVEGNSDVVSIDFDELELPDYGATHVEDLDDEALSAFMNGMHEARFLKAAGRDESMRREVGLLVTKDKNKQAEEATLKSMLAELRRKHGAEAASKALKAAEVAITKRNAATVSSIRSHMQEDGDAETLTLADLPSLTELLEQQAGQLGNDIERFAIARARSQENINAQTIEPDNLGHYENLGIRGFSIERTHVNLPRQLWRGRFLMVRIPDIVSDIEDRNEWVNRPAMLHRAFMQIDKYGEPEIAGLELYPCTRNAANRFQHGLPVRPLKSKDPRKSALVPERLIRIPVTSEHLQPEQPKTGTFFELLPHMVRKFDEKMMWFEESGRKPMVIGLETVPDHWIPIELPPAPEERVRGKILPADYDPSTMQKSTAKRGRRGKVKEGGFSQPNAGIVNTPAPET